MLLPPQYHTKVNRV